MTNCIFYRIEILIRVVVLAKFILYFEYFYRLDVHFNIIEYDVIDF